jgi:glycosyltransferase involved in cell wall biosynthesis
MKNLSVLICTCVDFTKLSAARNRLLRMSRSLSLLNIDCKIISISTSAIIGNYELNEKVLHYKVGDRYKNKIWSILPKSLKHSLICRTFYKKNLTSIVSENNTDIIIGYTYLSIVGSMLLNKCREIEIPIVFDLVENFNIKIHYLLNGVNIQQQIFYSKYLKYSSGVICISPSWSEWANRKQLPNVYISSFFPDRSLIIDSRLNQKDSLELVFMGNLISRELIIKIFSAIKLCKNKGLTINMKIIGTNKMGYRQWPAILYLKFFSKISKHVTFLGFLEDSEKDIALSNADVFILLRKDDKETMYSFPTRVPEYLSYGKPLILSKSNYLSSIFEHHKDIFFISKENKAEELSEQLYFIYQNKSFAKDVGIASYDKASVIFSSSNFGRALSNFLSLLVDDRQRK